MDSRWTQPPTRVHRQLGLAVVTLESIIRPPGRPTFWDAFPYSAHSKAVQALMVLAGLNIISLGCLAEALIAATSFEMSVDAWIASVLTLAIAFPFGVSIWLQRGFKTYRPRVEFELLSDSGKRRLRRNVAIYAAVSVLLFCCSLAAI